MPGSEMRLAKQHEDHRVGMTQASFGDFRSGVTVAGANFAQIVARHAVKAVESFAVIARGHQQVVKRSAVVSPVEIEADALAKFVLVNFAAPPLVEDVLVAGING